MRFSQKAAENFPSRHLSLRSNSYSYSELDLYKTYKSHVETFLFPGIFTEWAGQNEDDLNFLLSYDGPFNF